MLGGIGKSPVAPGTAATIVAGIPCAVLLSLLPPLAAWVLLSALIGVSIYTADAAEQELGTTDPSEVVIDELVGYLATMIGFSLSVETLFLGAAAFRFFDIWKPWPVSFFEKKVPGGMGIVLDDLAAGVLAHLSVLIILAAWN
jgi:phosphatidylglycerophosphatase A